MSTKLKCIYCNKEKNENDFTLEHIFPTSLGGNLCGEFFETRLVCYDCNTKVGLFIDGAFIKSWISKNYKYDDFLKYVDWENGSALPLIYMGVFDEIYSENDEICELWLGPCGDQIYHFHTRDDDRFNSYAGGDPIKRKSDPGYAFLFLASNNPNWIKIVLMSFRKHFKKSIRYPGNIRIDNGNYHKIYFHPVPKEKLNLLNELKKLRGKKHKCRIAHKLDIEKRFLCKFALGMGYKILGSKFLESHYADILRDAMWNIGKKDYSNYSVRGSGSIFDQKSPIQDILAWDGGHTIVFIPIGEYLMMSIFLFGRIPLNIVISDEPSLWNNKSDVIDEDGIVLVVIPQLNKCVGPISLPEYLGHLQTDYKIQELTEIERLKIDKKSLPPFR